MCGCGHMYFYCGPSSCIFMCTIDGRRSYCVTICISYSTCWIVVSILKSTQLGQMNYPKLSHFMEKSINVNSS